MTDGDDIILTDVSAIMSQGLGSLRVDSLLLPTDAVSSRLVAGATGTNGHGGRRSDARCLIPSSLEAGVDRNSLGGTLVGEIVDTIDDGAGWCHLRRIIARLVGQIVHGARER